MADSQSPSVQLPAHILTPRLLLRPPEEADAGAVNAGVCASFDALQPYMDWAVTPPTLADSRAFCITGSRELAGAGMCPLLMFRRSDGMFLGGTGCANYDLAIPKFELGYWCVTSETGNGYVTEAVRAQCRLLFETFGARRIELRMDERNVASAAVAQRLGFALEGTLVNAALANDGSPRNLRVYGLYQLPAWTEARA